MKKSNTISTMTAISVLLFYLSNNALTQTIIIGTQTWTARNLNVITFKNGDTIPEAKTNAEWNSAGESGSPAWCYYNNDPSNGKYYGKLYNWYAVSDPRGLAPKGWHVPSNDEWTILSNFLGGESVAGTKMKSQKGWHNNGNGSNSNGFTAIPGGNRFFSNGNFIGIGYIGEWWSSSVFNSIYVWIRNLYFAYAHLASGACSCKNYGLSVRCLRD